MGGVGDAVLYFVALGRFLDFGSVFIVCFFSVINFYFGFVSF